MMVVPAVATAAVMVNDTVSVSVSNTAHNSVYLEKGTGYKIMRVDYAKDAFDKISVSNTFLTLPSSIT